MPDIPYPLSLQFQSMNIFQERMGILHHMSILPLIADEYDLKIMSLQLLTSPLTTVLMEIHALLHLPHPTNTFTPTRESTRTPLPIYPPIVADPTTPPL